MSLETDFWSRVQKTEDHYECWTWAGSIHKGYGRFQGRPAHQIAWELNTGMPFPQGLHACHHCDNPVCVNPLHIWPGTAAQNNYDRDRKGRNGFTSRTHCSKGHAYEEDGKERTDRKGRRCLTCDREALQEFRGKPDYRERANAYDKAYRQRLKATKG